MSTRSTSALETPLDEILGAQANVQILRILTHHETPLGRSEASRRVGITPQGGRKAIDRLFDAGIVEYVGSGSTQQVRLRNEHPLAAALVSLFEAERARYEGLIHAIRASAGELERPPQALWIQGRVAEGIDEYGDPLILGLLAKADEVDELAEGLRDLLVDVQRDYDVTIDVRAYTTADLVAVFSEDTETLSLLGPGPSRFVSNEETREGPHIRQHQQHDERALHRARRLADLLVKEPALRDRALEWLNEKLQQEGEDRELREWWRILQSTSLPRLRRLLTADTDRAVRLRQSLPFWPVLSSEQREEILAETIDESRPA